MTIKSKMSHIIDASGTVLFLLDPAPPESDGPCVFSLASRKWVGHGWAMLGPELPIKPMPCLHCSFFGMTALLNHPWLSQLALNHRHTPSTGPTIW